MLVRQAIAYTLLIAMIAAIGTWWYVQRKRQRDEIRRRHGPRLD